MPIIDTHAHDVPLLKKLPVLFDRLGGALPQAPGSPDNGEPPTLAQLLADMDEIGVTASLIVLYAQVDEFLRLAREQPGRLFGLAFYDSLHPAESLERVQALCDEHPDLILGVSTALPFFHQDPRQREFHPLYEFCQQRGLPIQFHVGGDAAMEEVSRPTAFGAVAMKYPGLSVICLHAGGSAYREFPPLLRRLPNLYLEVEGLQEADLAGQGHPDILQELLRVAPSRKLMFGSNRTHPNGPYAARVQAVRTLPRRQREDVCWRSATAVYGLCFRNGNPAAAYRARSFAR